MICPVKFQRFFHAGVASDLQKWCHCHLSGHPPNSAAADLLPNHGIVGWNSEQVADTISGLTKQESQSRKPCANLVRHWKPKIIDHWSPIFRHLSIFHLLGLASWRTCWTGPPASRCPISKMLMPKPWNVAPSAVRMSGVKLAPGASVCPSTNQLGVLPGLWFFWV